jgi:hypothetical protein
MPSFQTDREREELLKKKARLLEAKLSGKHYSENEPYVPQSAEVLDKLRKRLQQHETTDPKVEHSRSEAKGKLPFKHRLDSKGKIPTSNPESHKKKRSPVLESSGEPDYFLESINNKLEVLANTVEDLRKDVTNKIDRITEREDSIYRIIIGKKIKRR